jgi:hypothetical protein
MTDLKLYRVTVEVTYYALAEHEDGAIEFYDEAAGDTLPERCAEVRAIRVDDPIAAGWQRNLCVYHDGDDDISLEEAIGSFALPPEVLP